MSFDHVLQDCRAAPYSHSLGCPTKRRGTVKSHNAIGLTSQGCILRNFHQAFGKSTDLAEGANLKVIANWHGKEMERALQHTHPSCIYGTLPLANNQGKKLMTRSAPAVMSHPIIKYDFLHRWRELIHWNSESKTLNELLSFAVQHFCLNIHKQNPPPLWKCMPTRAAKRHSIAYASEGKKENLLRIGKTYQKQAKAVWKFVFARSLWSFQLQKCHLWSTSFRRTVKVNFIQASGSRLMLPIAALCCKLSGGFISNMFIIEHLDNLTPTLLTIIMELEHVVFLKTSFFYNNCISTSMIAAGRLSHYTIHSPRQDTRRTHPNQDSPNKILSSLALEKELVISNSH